MGFSLQNGIQPVSDYMQSSFILSFFVSYDYSEKINDKNYPNVHCMRQSLIYSSDFLGLINQDWVIKWLSKKNLLLKKKTHMSDKFPCTMHLTSVCSYAPHCQYFERHYLLNCSSRAAGILKDFPI